MGDQAANAKMIGRLMLRLLPIQVLLASISAVNSVVSSLFASNAVGALAMGAVGLYGPVAMLIGAVSYMLMGGAAILCGNYMGKNQHGKVQRVFSLDLTVTAVIALLFTSLLLVFGVFDLTDFFTGDEAVRRIFNRYLLGQAIGVFPHMAGNQLAAFLSLENRTRRTTAASLAFIAANLVLNVLFVRILRWEAFGLALASSLGVWVFFAVQARYFFTEEANLRFVPRDLPWRESGRMMWTGFGGASSYVYQTLRGFLVNRLLELFVGTAGISAFAAGNTFLGLFWALPTGMVAVSRMLVSVSIGEEDRQSLADVMRTMVRRYLPLMCAVSALLIVMAVPMTRLYYRDPSEPVYMMTVWGFRILPLCMPLSIICMHFVCYGQASGKQGMVHLLSVLDGVVFVAGFTALLIRRVGMNSVYVANVLNGIGTTVIILAYAWISNRHFPKNMEELMVIPAGFGAPAGERLDLTVKSMEDIVEISGRVQAFCLGKGIDRRRAHLAGLALEEMAGNVVEHGFTKDRKSHTVDVRVVHKDNDVILRLRDDCAAFDPAERRMITEPEDITKNIGIRMVYSMASDIQYQNILGLNVLTVRI